VTLAPIEAPARGIGGNRYKVGPRCANPGCSNWADHAHHIFRRSLLAGDYPYVEVAGVTYGNLTGLCHRCHDAVTGRVGGHSNAIRLEDGVFVWCEVETLSDHLLRFRPLGPLEPQPPTPDLTVESRAPESEHCPFCGQPRRRRESAGPAQPRRRRKNWTVAVPADSEDGAAILDAFVDDIAVLLGAGAWHERNRRYWALVHALAWVMQRREEFARDVKAAAA